MKNLTFIIISFLLLFNYTNSLWGICIRKELLFTKYTLTDQYQAGNQMRSFQWDKIDSMLTLLDSFQHRHMLMATIRNYKNTYGEIPLVEPHIQGKYNNLTDTFGVERYQSIPLYSTDSIPRLVRYGRDGALGAVIGDSVDYYKMTFAFISGEWFVPKKYVYMIGPVFFRKSIFVDRTNQNITTIAQRDSCWYVHSMNPATTGLNRPPYQKPTPKGVFVIQEQKPRMIFYKDGTNIEGGFAPYASRFCCGGYIHGVPVNYPATSLIEYSPTLGTNPRSHMCVRNATSHALFIYNWVNHYDTLVFVFD